MSTHKAHIFKQRNVGEREEVKLKIFGSDGEELDLAGGGGSSSMIYQGMSEASEFFLPAVPQSPPVPLEVGFGQAGISYISGFEVEQGDPTLPALEGAYETRVVANWNWEEAPDPPAGSGYAICSLVFIYGDSIEVMMNNIELNTLHDTDGLGDFPFVYSGEKRKVDVNVAPENGYFVFRAEQSVQAEDMNFSAEITIVKL